MFSPLEDAHLRLDEDVANFVESHINSFIKWDIVVLFYNNPGLSDTPSSIARDLGRKEQDVQKALDELVESKVLDERKYGGDKKAYFIRKAKLDIVARFIDSLASREARLAILSRILKREENSS